MTRDWRLEPRRRYKVAAIDPWLGAETVAARFQQVYDRIDLIARKLDSANGTKPSKSSVKRWFPTFGLPRSSLPMYWREGPAAELNRLSSMLSGPLYTSDEFPWPRRTQFREGKMVEADGYCEPLFQIELDLLSQIAGINLGSGLVQVWMDGLYGSVRHIDGKSISKRELTPVREGVLSFFSRGRPDGNIYRDWSDEKNTAPWLTSGWQFHSIGRPCHEIPYTLECDLDDLGIGQMQADHEVDYQGSEEEATAALKLLEQTQKRYWRSNSPASRKGLMRAGSLFGKFYSVQGYHDEYFENTALTLVDMSDGDTFWWNYGSAQLITDSGNPGRNFCFDWSTS